jgi:hypothetical protein
MDAAAPGAWAKALCSHRPSGRSSATATILTEQLDLPGNRISYKFEALSLASGGATLTKRLNRYHGYPLGALCGYSLVAAEMQSTWA